jgi:catechol 2,3-dioxygenase-like lactoylglutathione lyase family enzyme
MFSPITTFSGFSVNDMAKASDFYLQSLGLKLAADKMGMQLELPAGGKVFIYEKSDHVPATFTVLNFVVPNIDEAVDALTAKGIQMERYDNMPASQDEKGILRGLSVNQGPDIAWFKDPAGNVLSVLQDA